MEFLIEPENELAVNIFMDMQTQWVISGVGFYVGLNYHSLDFLFKLYSVKDRRKVFEQIQIIERSALKVLDEKQEKAE